MKGDKHPVYWQMVAMSKSRLVQGSEEELCRVGKTLHVARGEIQPTKGRLEGDI